MFMDFRSFTFQWMNGSTEVMSKHWKKALANQSNPWEFGFSCPSPSLLEIVGLTRSWGNARFCHVSSRADRGNEDRCCLHHVKLLSKGGSGVQADSGAWGGDYVLEDSHLPLKILLLLEVISGALCGFLSKYINSVEAVCVYWVRANFLVF